jgi:hypothetical protein
MNAVQIGFFKEVLEEMEDGKKLSMGLKIIGERHYGSIFAGVYVPSELMGKLLVKVIDAFADADLTTHDGINFKVEEYKEDDFTDIFLYNPDSKTDDWHQDDLQDFLQTMRTKD